MIIKKHISYDYRFGKPIRTVDVNGNEMRYVYDAAGRNTALLAPYEIDSGRPYTIKMDYYPKNYGGINIFGNDTTQSYARTSHYDPQHIFAKTTVYGKEQHPQGNLYINGREVETYGIGSKTARIIYQIGFK